MMKLFLVVLSVTLMSRVEGFLFSRRSSSSTSQSATHTSTNNCHCANQMHIGTSMASMLQQLLAQFGKREAATMLDLEEDYPGLDEFLEHAGMKRDGTLDFEDFASAVRRQASHSSQSNSPNMCHCGRMVVDSFNDLI